MNPNNYKIVHLIDQIPENYTKKWKSTEEKNT